MFMRGQLTPDQRVQKAVIDIMAHERYVALAGVLMIGSRRVESDAAKCPTAYTNGRDEVYGADFIAEMNDRQLRFLDTARGVSQTLSPPFNVAAPVQGEPAAGQHGM
jgi:hypothetical protein